jgi:hypothetical protein
VERRNGGYSFASSTVLSLMPKGLQVERYKTNPIIEKKIIIMGQPYLSD